MGKIADTLITKDGTNTESYYDYLISKYVAPFFTLFFKNIGIKNPNSITLYSFSLIMITSIMIFFFELIDSVLYRILIALLIQISFALDCSDGQLARIIGKVSKHGAWLDRILDRVGEFIIFVCFGFFAWWWYQNILFLYLGIITGYGLSVFTMAMTIADSVRYNTIDAALDVQRNDNRNETDKKSNKKRVISVVKKVFFFLNFGIGERYLYLSFFIIINRVDIMLYFTAFLTTFKFLGISHYIGNRLKKMRV